MAFLDPHHPNDAGAGVLDPPFKKRPPGPIPSASASLLLRFFGGLLLAGLATQILFSLFRPALNFADFLASNANGVAGQF